MNAFQKFRRSVALAIGGSTVKPDPELERLSATLKEDDRARAELNPQPACGHSWDDCESYAVAEDDERPWTWDDKPTGMADADFAPFVGTHSPLPSPDFLRAVSGDEPPTKLVGVYISPDNLEECCLVWCSNCQHPNPTFFSSCRKCDRPLNTTLHSGAGRDALNCPRMTPEERLPTVEQLAETLRIATGAAPGIAFWGLWIYPPDVNCGDGWGVVGNTAAPPKGGEVVATFTLGTGTQFRDAAAALLTEARAMLEDDDKTTTPENHPQFGPGVEVIPDGWGSVGG